MYANVPREILECHAAYPNMAADLATAKLTLLRVHNDYAHAQRVWRNMTDEVNRSIRSTGSARVDPRSIRPMGTILHDSPIDTFILPQPLGSEGSVAEEEQANDYLNDLCDEEERLFGAVAGIARSLGPNAVSLPYAVNCYMKHYNQTAAQVLKFQGDIVTHRGAVQVVHEVICAMITENNIENTRYYAETNDPSSWDVPGWEVAKANGDGY